jgi:Fur family ferric uptake transcriptional regulator
MMGKSEKKKIGGSGCGVGTGYMTKQKRMILTELQAVDTHPSADAVYEMVRRKMPKISMGTVYRNLEQMVKDGLILKLDGGMQKRYDGNTNPHHHFRCLNCGEMIDLPLRPMDDIRNMIQTLRELDIRSYELEFTGYCPKCRQEKKKSHE